MSEVQHVVQHLDWSFEGEAWHGPAVLEAIEGVTAKQASARPIPGAHTIHELVRHIAAWKNVVRRRIDGEIVRPTDAEDWPPVAGDGDAAWKSSIAELHEAHRALTERIARLTEADLDRTPRESSVLHRSVHGIVHHDLYHAGQIVLLRKGLPRDSG